MTFVPLQEIRQSASEEMEVPTCYQIGILRVQLATLIPCELGEESNCCIVLRQNDKPQG